MNQKFQKLGGVVMLALILASACSGQTTHGKTSLGKEGGACDSAHVCEDALSCVASPFQLNVCGRGCGSKDDCKSDERCFSYSGNARDGHCVNVIEDEYGTCGVSETSICATGLTCLYLPQEPYGLCVNTCALDGRSAPVARDDDAGVETDADAGALPSDAPAGAVICAAEQSCVDMVLADPDANEGVCGKVAERGEPCGIEKGIFCRVGIDICAPKDPTDLGSETLCFQDCSDAKTTCDSGKCVPVQNLFAYCM